MLITCKTCLYVKHYTKRAYCTCWHVHCQAFVSQILICIVTCAWHIRAYDSLLATFSNVYIMLSPPAHRYLNYTLASNGTFVSCWQSLCGYTVMHVKYETVRWLPISRILPTQPQCQYESFGIWNYLVPYGQRVIDIRNRYTILITFPLNISYHVHSFPCTYSYLNPWGNWGTFYWCLKQY